MALNPDGISLGSVSVSPRTTGLPVPRAADRALRLVWRSVITMEDQHCSHCASPRILRAPRTAFTIVSRCAHCGRSFAHPLSVVLLDPTTARREELVSLLRAEGIRVVPLSRVVSLERWPVGDALVTHVAHSIQSWIDVRATHVIVLADTDEERFLAQRNGASAVVASHDTAAILSILRSVAQASAASGKSDQN